MSAKARIHGHDAVYDSEAGVWRYVDTGEVIIPKRTCHRCGRKATLLCISGKCVEIDACIAPVVLALDAGGIETVASCCGHGYIPGNIMLADGRELLIDASREESRRVYDALYPWTIHGEPREINTGGIGSEHHRDDAEGVDAGSGRGGGGL